MFNIISAGPIRLDDGKSSRVNFCNKIICENKFSLVFSPQNQNSELTCLSVLKMVRQMTNLGFCILLVLLCVVNTRDMSITRF